MSRDRDVRDVILNAAKARVSTAAELYDTVRAHNLYCGRGGHFFARLDRLVRRGLLVKIQGGKGGKANRYATADFLMGLTDKDIAADYAEERGDTEKAAFLRAARRVQTGPKPKEDHTR